MSDTQNETGTETIDREKLLKRIRALFAMSQEHETSPNEAEIAMRRCQLLMNQHGIQLSDLETSEFGQSRYGEVGASIPYHLKALGVAVGVMTDTICVVMGGSERGMEFRGYEIDVHVAGLMMDYLSHAIDRSCTLRRRSGMVGSGRSAGFDYKRGYAHEVLKRCEEADAERKRAEQDAAGASQSMVVQKTRIVKERMGKDLHTKRASARSVADHEAHAAGKMDGAAVSLNAQVGGRNEQRALPSAAT